MGGYLPSNYPLVGIRHRNSLERFLRPPKSYKPSEPREGEPSLPNQP